MTEPIDICIYTYRNRPTLADCTSKIIRTMDRPFRLHIVCDPGGVAKNWNRAQEIVESPRFVMMHDDAFPLVKDWLSKLEAELDRDEKVAVVGGVEIRSANSLRKWQFEGAKYVDRELGYERVAARLIPGAMTLIDGKRCSSELWMDEECPGVSDGPEWDFYFRVNKSGYKVVATAAVPIWHPCHDNLETGQGIRNIHVNGNGEPYTDGNAWHGFDSAKARDEDFVKSRNWLGVKWPKWPIDGAGFVDEEGVLIEAKTVLL